MTSRRLFTSLGALVLMGVGCGGDGPVDPGVDAPAGAAEERIVGGTGYSGLPAVGALTYYGGLHCTATLIGPRKVVTAAHCLAGINRDRMRFVIGANAYSPEYSLRIESTAVHPYYSSSSLNNDIAYATLSTDAPVEPMRLVDTMDASWRGESLFFVGYGVTNGSSQSGAGYKRAVWMDVSQVNTGTFRYDDPGKNTCNGDSGGPAFYRDAAGEYLIAGVTSWGDWSCTDFGVDTRTDIYKDFLGVITAPALDPTQGSTPDQDLSGCGTETWAGRCDSGAAIWCENDTVYTSDCASRDLACGWSDANDYYGCIEPPDPCNGETYAGRCDGGTVIWCENQEVNSIDCSSGCGWDSSGDYYNCQ